MSQTWAFIRGLAILTTFVAICGWLLWLTIRKSDDPAGMAVRWTATFIILIGGFFGARFLVGDGEDPSAKFLSVCLAMVLGLCLAILWVPTVAGKVGDWFASLYTGGNTPPDPTPFYSIAQALRKKGRFEEAIAEIQSQLERFPHDVTGHMLMAEIHAEDLKDMASAHLTLEGFCQQPGHPASHIAEAMNRLADWQMKLRQDPAAARRALQTIVDLLPGTQQAQVAAQRLAHLGDDGAIETIRERKPIHLPVGVENLGLLGKTPQMKMPGENPEEAAARLVAHLTEHPLDTEAREKLAMIYAEHYERLDLAADQLNQLADSPNHPPRDVARWLNLLADLQVKFGADYEAVRETLQRLVDRFPGLAPAELAQQRIEHLKLEFKNREKTAVVKLGTYEQNIGLKGRKPPAA